MTAVLTPLAPAAESRPLRGRPGLAPATASFTGRSLTHTIRNADALVMAIVLPVMLMLVFTYVFGGAIDSGGGYVDYVVPGIILLCAGFGASGVAVDVAEDLTAGFIDRIRTMPVAAGAVIAGHVIASVVRNLVATGIVIGVALLVGFRPTAGPLEWLGAIGVVTLWILAITWLFAAVGLTASGPEAASGYGFVLLFLPYLSSAFVPVDTMPEWLQRVAEHQPVTPIIETIRGLLMGTPIDDQAWWAVGWCVLLIAIGVVWSTWAFGRKSGRR
ncbi:ABC transporter permease [Agromyces seonyuensis]|uniref:Transport permease protein n=1 Tax=Agromyces seonyuensis TaxID=2662446 RepID=A0A6I4P3A7_9MICO|nr:ABC transporter permease [Agromyces seonyuensis]MWB99295.1 ABC transporter permease [Agromyces seonyuensis]